MPAPNVFANVMGVLAVCLGLLAYAIYFWQTVAREIRPHPLSWGMFAIVTATGFWVQWDQNGGPGSWVMGVTAVICLLLAFTSIWKGEQAFPWYEWAFLVSGAFVFLFYLHSRNSTLSAILAASVDLLGYGPTVSKAWSRPYTECRICYGLNSAKFFPALLAMQTVSIATFVYPITLIIANAAVVVFLIWRRSVVPEHGPGNRIHALSGSASLPSIAP